MSGYLSRIVQSASGSSRQLRPLAGSIFGVPTEPERALPPRFNDEPLIVETEAHASTSDTSNSQRPATAGQSHQSSETVFRNYQPLQPRRESNPPQFHENLARFELPHSSTREHSHAAEVSLISSPRADSTTPQTADTAEVKHAFTARIAQRTPQAPDVVREHAALHAEQSASAALNGLPPNVDPAERKDSAQSILTDRPQLASRRMLDSAKLLSLGDQRTQHPAEPNIEIHIGRIEVLAVQPPAPPTPSPRRDRTTSLADYLAGQNGRRS